MQYKLKLCGCRACRNNKKYRHIVGKMLNRKIRRWLKSKDYEKEFNINTGAYTD